MCPIGAVSVIIGTMDRKTVQVYEHNVEEWIAHRRRPRPPRLDAFVRRVPPGVRADIGCGPGWHSGELGAPVVALDASAAMARQVFEFAPRAWPVVADLEQLPFRTGSLTGGWAQKSYMHIPAEHMPLALADAHRALALGGALHVQVTSNRRQENHDKRFPGRHFTWWPPERLRDVIEGAGFDVVEFVDDGEEWLDIEATRARLLPDTVGAGMRVLVVGLNPSLLSADRGVGFARPGNRFWPAALASRLVTRALDPIHALRVDSVGMTNLARRATAAASEITAGEYRDGAQRLTRLVEWLRPGSVCFVGLTGYRAAVDKHAAVGWQADGFGDVPTYVMPNTSGLNAHAKPADFADHLRIAQSPT
jgi:double-stranded uracil-DNA glycosylase